MKTSALFPALLRLALGWTFFWPFLDKMFGLGFSTPAGKGWIDGFSPTTAFLAKAVKGPLAPFFHGLAGQGWVDFLFMLGLCLIGLALLLGIGMRVACYAGVLLVALMYLSLIWPAQNPFLDEHVIYALALLWLSVTPAAGDILGFGRHWKKSDAVKKQPFLA